MSKQSPIMSARENNTRTKIVPRLGFGVPVYAKCLISNKLPPPPKLSDYQLVTNSLRYSAHSRILKILFLTIILAFIALSLNAQTIRYVRQTGAPAADGLDWTASPSNDLQAMINISNAGDTICVSTGIYKPNRPANDLNNTSTPNNRDNAFVLKTGVVILGGFSQSVAPTYTSNRNWTTNVTTLSGDIGNPNDSTDNCYHVVVASGSQCSGTLDGFTVTKGNADVATSINFNGGGFADRAQGGGIHIRNSSPNLTNLIVEDNDCPNYGGGGFYIGNTIPNLVLMTNVIIRNNTARVFGGGIYGNYFVLTNGIISGNTTYAGDYAGIQGNNFKLINVRIENNYSTFTCGGLLAGDCELTNVVVVKNNPNGINMSGTNYLTNVTVSGNQGIGIRHTGGSSIIRNSIIWDNAGGDVSVAGGTPVYLTSLVGGVSLGNGIISNSNPLFVNAAGGNYHLQSSSPVIDAGSNSCFAVGSTPDLSYIKVDFDSNYRINNCAIDLVAYEYQTFVIGGLPSAEIGIVDTTICMGNSVNIPFILTGAPQWQIVYTKNNGTTYDTIKNIPSSPFNWNTGTISSNTTFKFVSVKDNNCWANINDSVKINIYPAPASVTHSNDTLCHGEKTTPIPFIDAQNKYKWYSSPLLDSIPTGMQTNPFGDYTVVNTTSSIKTTEITIIPILTNNGASCEGTDTTRFSIFVLSNNGNAGDITCDSSVCINSDVSCLCSSQGGVWSVSDGKAQIIGSPTDNPVTIRGISQGQTDIIYTGKCGATTTFPLKIRAKITPTIKIRAEPNY